MIKTRVGNPCHILAAALLVAGCTSAGSPATSAASHGTSLRQVLDGFQLDDRLTLCHVWQRPDGSLAGFVEMPQYREVLKRAGFDVSNVKLLPEESATTDRFGIATAEHAILRKTPRDEPGDRDNATDALRTEPLWILDRKSDGMMLVHTSDGYLGWIEADAMEFADAKTITERLNQSLLPIDLKQPGFEFHDRYRDAEVTRRRETVRQVINLAKELLGTRYVWGGKTKDGIDCSGLVQTSFAQHGILLPRDACQQANVGRLVATRWFMDALLPGDLLFFISGRRGNVSHVAIYMGDGRYIEAAGKDVHIRSMTPGDADYDAERASTFAWARRVIE